MLFLMRIMKKMKKNIKVHANSKQEKIVKIDENNFEVWIKEKPIDDKANLYLEKILKKYFEKDVKIVSGLKFKKKIIEIF